jgi:phage shock protein PspC (stress-responsive transcriptional regulator)
MKKALKINLGGQIFHIDEDAYEKLKIYLETISSHFSNIEESKEILNDIESRIAEIFNEKRKDSERVVSIEDVREVIEIMGKPEEIVDEQEIGSKESWTDSRQRRRLYRDPDNGVIGGVTAGLSAYFNIDLLALRILFVVLLLIGGGTPFFIYLVLWIAVPKATTAAEKLEMKGEKVNVSNLEKKIREEYEGVRENFKKARSSETGQKTENLFNEFFRILGVVLLAILKIIVALIAIGFIVAGFSIIISMIGFAFLGAGSLPFGFFHMFDFDPGLFPLHLIDPVNMVFIAVSAILVILIPILAITYGLFKALFRFRARDKGLGVASLVIWVIALFALITFSMVEADHFSRENEISQNISLNSMPGDTLYLSMNPFKISQMPEGDKIELDDTWYMFGDDEYFYGNIQVEVRKSRNEEFDISIERSSRGSDWGEAAELAGDIEYNYDIDGSSLELDPYFSAEAEDNFRLQKLMITISVPEDKAIHFHKNTADYLSDVDTEKYISSYRMAGKTWIMEENGLVEAE